MEQYSTEPEPQRSPSTFIYSLPIRLNNQDSATNTNSTTAQLPTAPARPSSQLNASSLLEWRAVDGREIMSRPLSPMTVQILSQRYVAADYRTVLPLSSTEAVMDTESASERERHTMAARIRQVCDICLRATKRYLEQRHRNFRIRNTSFSLNSNGPVTRGYPSRVALTAFRSGAHHQSMRLNPYFDSRPLPAIPVSPDGTPNGILLAKITRICDYLWALALRDRLVLPGTERETVANMAQLLEWAEVVAGCGNRSELTESAIDRLDLLHLFQAASSLCSWFGDSEGEARLREVERALFDV
ncbi:hypothetical protein CORC01_11672 [Colletotrichum orchidophilum]|uniref:Uncharacterized protein n=1 Tax=Colletotrichum orchidophilum TaxID=1209926 RepID=A0A1G4AVE6_9PEZI|nr:uncharacterized protein CORC01_11672 [Colletotrichum orchidophilum]OHE93033.1 hypothetical protein CORC01_11672 [Colletotrichum orchidophilum]